MTDQKTVTPEEPERRSQEFNEYVNLLEFNSVHTKVKESVIYPCPCCGYKTLKERGGFDICPVCFWEDDGQDDQDADRVRGGPNGSLSLTEARANYQQDGACEERFQKNVRPPRLDEI